MLFLLHFLCVFFPLGCSSTDKPIFQDFMCIHSPMHSQSVRLKSTDQGNAWFNTCPWGACEEDLWWRSMHQVQLLKGQNQTSQPLPQFCHRLPYSTHLHTWGGVTVDIDRGGRTNEPAKRKTTHAVVHGVYAYVCVCVCVYVCVCTHVCMHVGACMCKCVSSTCVCVCQRERERVILLPHSPGQITM